MGEVEKLYELAGIEKEFEQPAECRKNPYILCEGCMFYDNGKCLNKKDYPPFTAEKQIELIKWLGSIKDYTVEIDKFKGVYYVGCREAGSNNKNWGSHILFEEALAELINDLWQDLTATEREEIKEILKG